MFDFFFFFQAEDGIRDRLVTGVQTCALPICFYAPRHAVVARLMRFLGGLDPGIFLQQRKINYSAGAFAELFQVLKLRAAVAIAKRMHIVDIANDSGGLSCESRRLAALEIMFLRQAPIHVGRSEEHTSELQSQAYLVCRLLLEKKKQKIQIQNM